MIGSQISWDLMSSVYVASVSEGNRKGKRDVIFNFTIWEISYYNPSIMNHVHLQVDPLVRS